MDKKKKTLLDFIMLSIAREKPHYVWLFHVCYTAYFKTTEFGGVKFPFVSYTDLLILSGCGIDNDQGRFPDLSSVTIS